PASCSDKRTDNLTVRPTFTLNFFCPQIPLPFSKLPIAPPSRPKASAHRLPCRFHEMRLPC
ncbi:hypothetical protein MM707_29500, partial [Klebsiella pneumoniae]|nr:hypothetical protein [Klebsiella pneumoniae]